MILHQLRRGRPMKINHDDFTKTSFRVSLALHGRVKELAYIEKRTVDSIIAEALENLLEKKLKENA